MARKKRNRNKNLNATNQQFSGITAAPSPAPDPNYGHINHAVDYDQDSYDDESYKPERGKEILDEVIIDAGGIPGVAKTDFVESGYTCTKCDWSTRKTKIKGIQALRAHWKRHVRDRRAIRNSYLLHVVVLAVVLLIGSSPTLFDESLANSRLNDYSLGIRVYADIFGKLIATISTALAVILLFVWNRYRTTGRRKWSPIYRWTERLWITFLISVAVMMWTDYGRGPELIWMASALLPWSASVVVRTGVAKTRIALVRREFIPKNQLKLLRAKDSETDSIIRRRRRGLKQRIRDGRVKLPDIGRTQKEFLRRLGLGDVQVDPAMEAKRLAKQQRELQKKAREQRRLEHKKKRERDSKLRMANRTKRPRKNSRTSER